MGQVRAQCRKQHHGPGHSLPGKGATLNRGGMVKGTVSEEARQVTEKHNIHLDC